MDTLNRRLVHILSEEEQNVMQCNHAPEDNTKVKTCTLLIPGTLHFIF